MVIRMGEMVKEKVFLPFFALSMTIFYETKDTEGGASRDEKEKVDQRLMPRQRPLGPNVNAEPRSERHRENLMNLPNTACPNENLDTDRAVPLAATFTAQTITVDDDDDAVPVVAGPKKPKKPRKRKRSRYHDAIFGDDTEFDSVKDDLSKLTTPITQMITSQHQQMMAQQSLDIMKRYEDAKQKLASSTDAVDIQFYTHMKNSALKMMQKLNESDEKN